MLSFNDFSSSEIMELVLENAYEGIIVIDEKGLIRYFNQAMEKIAGVKREDVLGKHVKQYSEATRLHLVLETGKPEIGIKCKVWDNVILNRIPIRKNGRTIGVLGIFLFKEGDLKNLVEKLKKYESKVQNYQQKISSLLSAEYELDDIVGENEAIQAAKALVKRVADKEVTIFITGESGTGKEMFAHSVHNLSPRRNKPFIKVNCASIPSELIEAELFGYEPGAFTGARNKMKMGKFQMADGGTLFLDEIGDMPLEMQAKVLRALQSKEVERLGGNEIHYVDFRIIAATNKDLQAAIKENKFRSDLFYRLNVLPIQLPPLRKRPDDIELLADFFMERITRKYNRSPMKLSRESLTALQAYPWPGNIRELLNAIIFSVNNCDCDIIAPRHLPTTILRPSQQFREPHQHITPLKSSYHNYEKEVILNALKRAGGNKSKAAKLLHIHRSTLYKKIDSLAL